MEKFFKGYGKSESVPISYMKSMLWKMENCEVARDNNHIS